MPLLTKSPAARNALIYVTLGALMVVWTGIWLAFLLNNPPETSTSYYWCSGFMLTGLTLLVIGFALGRIGRAARDAELPPVEVTRAVAEADRIVAAGVPVVTPPGTTIAAQPTPVIRQTVASELR